jgi:regulator of extracellular matrix RemA (YlzA/DUF370 family)
MESIYYVMTWLCHRRCVHCYEDRFRPYYGAELDTVVSESRGNFERIIANFPERMTFVDRKDGREKRGRIILAGGEILLPAVRETVLYPALDLLRHRYEACGGVDLIIQTTGDTLTPKMVEELLAHGVQMISVSGIDPYHEGLESPEAREKLQAKLTAMFEAAGMRPVELDPERSRGSVLADAPGGQPSYLFFGANPDTWIGKIWPRGRAWQNQLSTATLADNFCANWSGGIGFLEFGYNGSEVSVEPNGNVYPCCMKTQLPIGSLLAEPLETIIARQRGNPVYEAISRGEPQAMGLSHGWTAEKFIEKSTVLLDSGRVYQNLCVGCDAFHREVLSQQSALVTITC